MKKVFSLAAIFCLGFALALQAQDVPANAKAAKKGGGKNAKAPKAAGAADAANLEKGAPAGFRKLNPGDKAPAFSLPGIDGKTYTLADFKDAPVLMVVFLSNHCPVSHAVEPRIIRFVDEMKTRGVAVVAINPNHPDAVRIDELGYSKYNDSFDEMKLYARETGFNFPYLYDGETQRTSAAFGCLATPHVFIFDKERALRYSGRFDDSRYADAGTITAHDARAATEEILAGKPVTTPETRPMGCSTKWLSKIPEVAKAEEAWKHRPVTLETIDDAGVAALVKNGTGRYRLINVWATWCAPCVREFPGFVKFSRQFTNRDFEFVSISIDDPGEQAQVLKFLQARHAGMPDRLARALKAEGRNTTNYLHTGAKTDALAKALDPAWDGPVPYTILVAPDGEIIYRQSGEISIAALREKLSQVLGTSYQPPASVGR